MSSISCPRFRLRWESVALTTATILACSVITVAEAAVTISLKPTANMTCSGGVCAPTAAQAVLNVTDLENLLSSGNVTVTTTGSGVQAKNIQVAAALSWSSGSTLALVAFESIAVDKLMAVGGVGGLSLLSNDGGKNGALSFGRRGHVTFGNLSSPLMINGAAYTLVNDIATLAFDIGGNPGGNFALAGSYDASADGIYAHAPIPTTFEGAFEGLGNEISNLKIVETLNFQAVGLFGEVGFTGSANDLALTKASVQGIGKGDLVGGLVGDNLGAISADYVSGSVAGKKKSCAGALVGDNHGTITDSQTSVKVNGTIAGGIACANNAVVIQRSYATGTVTGDVLAGGLVGDNSLGQIIESYSTGATKGSDGADAGGLVGFNDGGVVQDCYAMGAVKAGTNASIGGLVGAMGQNNGEGGISSTSYSTGALTGGSGSFIGGFIGFDGTPPGNITHAYWDTDTSGIANVSQGAGNIANDPGIAGLTTAQLQSGLPQGFDPAIWSETANINNGLPYLLANPPPK